MYTSKLMILTITAAITFLYGCAQVGNPHEEPEITVKRWHYENGNLKKVQGYKNDSIEHGIYLFYYPSGMLKDSARIHNNKFHGKRHVYYENGTLHKLTTYFNNELRNGVTYSKNSLLQHYTAYNYTENVMFLIHYDSLGKWHGTHQGSSIYSWIINDTIPQGKKFDIELLVADPPNCITEVIIGNWDILDKRLTSRQKYSPDKFNRIIYPAKQIPDIDQYIFHETTIQDTIEQTVIVDTLFIMINRNGITSYTNKIPK